MTGVIIRPAEAKDLPGIVALLADDDLGRGREDPAQPPNPKYLEAFTAMQGDENQLLVVAEIAEAVVGYLQLTFIPGLSRQGMWRGQIESVRVAAGQRGSGLGRQLFDWTIAACRERGCGLVQLTTDKVRIDAKRFYESIGFTASHEGMKLSL